jgi:hypothetical protein
VAFSYTCFAATQLTISALIGIYAITSFADHHEVSSPSIVRRLW